MSCSIALVLRLYVVPMHYYWQYMLPMQTCTSHGILVRRHTVRPTHLYLFPPNVTLVHVNILIECHRETEAKYKDGHRARVRPRTSSDAWIQQPNAPQHTVDTIPIVPSLNTMHMAALSKTGNLQGVASRACTK